MFKKFENVCHLPTGKRGKIIRVKTYGFCGTRDLTEYAVRLWDEKRVIWCKPDDLTHCLTGKRNLRLVHIPTGGDAA